MSPPTVSSATSDRYIDVDNARIRYRDEGSGPPVLLLHGWTLDLEMWNPQVEELAGLYRMVRFDRRGFGLSTGQPSLASDVADARRLCLQLGIEGTAVLGMSQGARVALQLAASAPRLASCVIVDGPPALSADESTDIPLADLREILRSRGIEALRDEWRRNPLATLRTPDRRMHELLERMIGRYSGGDLAAGNEPAAQIATPAPSATPAPATTPAPTAMAARTEWTATLHVPLLVLNGAHDLETRRRAGQALAQTSPSAEYVLVPEAGHLPNLDNPRAYNETIRSFLSRHLPRESLP